MAALIDGYKRTWDPEKEAWTKRGDAADFALFLAGELQISPRGIEVDKDGKLYRVLVPLLSAYWCPRDDNWERYLSTFKKRIKEWASA